MRRLTLTVFIPILLAGFQSGASAAWFIRGDVDGDQTLKVTDPVRVFNYLFLGERDAVGCQDAADANDDGRIDLTDGIYLLSHLFLGGPAPVAQVAGCWLDPTDDALGCESYDACRSVGAFLIAQRSGSMAAAGAWQRVQKEMIKVIQSLSDEDQFAIAFFDANLIKFPASGLPAAATEEIKASAVSMTSSTQTGAGTCQKPALFAGLTSAAQSTVSHRLLIYFGNGFATCNGMDAAVYGKQTLAEVKARNTAQLPIDVFCVGGSGGVDQAWCKDLATQNGGSFVRVVSP